MVSILWLLMLLCGCDGARILGVFPHVGKSHWDMFEPLMLELARRGHQVTVLSPFPQTTPPSNYTDVSVAGAASFLPATGGIDIRSTVDSGRFAKASMLAYIGAFTCESVLSLPATQRLLNSNVHFDFLLIEQFNTDCFLGFAHRFKAPFAAISSCALMPWASDRFGNPDNPSYIPNLMEGLPSKMTFMERFANTFHYLLQKIFYNYLYHSPTEAIARKYFGSDLPPLDDIALNTSLILVNTHYSVNIPRPLVPGVIEVAGLHIHDLKQLPQDIEKFISEAQYGVIYFSWGSMIRAETLHEDKKKALLAAFAELPQRVLWKWENESMSGIPKNVMVKKWMPQFDILNHPKVRVYMGHGGLLGSIEAVHIGIPMIGTPFFGDQWNNMKNLEQKGMAYILNYDDITKANVLAAVHEVLENPSYRETAKRLSSEYHDRPMNAMDTAIYWIEHVIRHGGGSHLRTAAVDLKWYQYLLLDVSLSYAVILSAIAWVLLKVTKAIALAVSRTIIIKQKVL